jgi:hypothetical protein
MKKVFIAMAMALPFLSLSQQCIVKDCDDMTDKCTYYPRHNMILANDEKTKGFTLDARIVEKAGQLSVADIMVLSVNIGSCNENDKLILMLSDSTKLSLTSWNKFNCEGNAWFSLRESDINRLGSNKIIKAYFQNGRSYDSFTKEITGEDQNYFVKLIADCRENKFTVLPK